MAAARIDRADRSQRRRSCWKTRTASPRASASSSRRDGPGTNAAPRSMRDDLQKIGVAVDVVALDATALFDRIGRAKCDAVYSSAVAIRSRSGDQPRLLVQLGSGAPWNIGQPKTRRPSGSAASTSSMTKQIGALDEGSASVSSTRCSASSSSTRRCCHFAAPRVIVATSSRVVNATPALALSPLMWSPDTLAVVH